MVLVLATSGPWDFEIDGQSYSVCAGIHRYGVCRDRYSEPLSSFMALPPTARGGLAQLWRVWTTRSLSLFVDFHFGDRTVDLGSWSSPAALEMSVATGE